MLLLVWPPPLSLATTRGISVDVFSSPYLDVSVQAVPLPYLFDSVWDTLRWVSPFGNLRIEAHLQLPEAYRSLSRPSSAPDAKAFPLRSFSLDLRRSDEAHSVSAASVPLLAKTPSASSPLLFKSKPACAGLLICGDTVFADLRPHYSNLVTYKKSPFGSLISRIMQAH